MEPKTSKGRQTRDRILSAAAKLIHVQGVHGTSVDQVLEVSGTGKSQFYSYFDSKDDLVHAVLEWQTREWHSRADDMFAQISSLDGIERWFQNIVARQANTDCVGGCPLGSLAAELADADQGLREEIAGEFTCRRSLIAGALERIRARGELPRSADLEKLADFIISTIQGAMLLASVDKSVEGMGNALEQVLDHLRSLQSR